MTTLVARVVEGVLVTMAGGVAVGALQNPLKAGSVVDWIVAEVGSVSPGWVVASAWGRGAMLGLAIVIVLVSSINMRGVGWGITVPAVAGMVFAAGVGILSVAVGLKLCAAANAWGLAPLAPALWIVARLAGRAHQAWIRFWSPFPS